MFTRTRAGLALVAMFFNTLVMVIPLYLLAILKFVLPINGVRIALSRGLVVIAESWIAINNLIINTFSGVTWKLEGIDSLDHDQWYFVISNHQSWADILVLQTSLNRHIPFLKFFLKQELIKVPLLGLAWWALDFPFMKRYSREEIEKNPSLKGKDLETTRKACEKFAHFPTSVMNFLEGTRFTQAKHDAQQSPFRHLLKPKSGGAAFTLNAMSGHLRTLVDVTIVYPGSTNTSLFAFLGGTIREVQVIVHQRDIPEWASEGDYENDAAFRERFQAWVSDIWSEKDQLLSQRLD
ncbi:MAG: acyltransferase [Alcanivoracaceae bacterium]|jgi:1-acyl-sn-glycerol-3-phosphate acyltransferase|nr:acyltransferase [Alcanivoracaceae bacterium]